MSDEQLPQPDIKPDPLELALLRLTEEDKELNLRRVMDELEIITDKLRYLIDTQIAN